MPSHFVLLVFLGHLAVHVCEFQHYFALKLKFLVHVMSCYGFYTEWMESCWVASIVPQHGWTQCCV